MRWVLLVLGVMVLNACSDTRAFTSLQASSNLEALFHLKGQVHSAIGIHQDSDINDLDAPYQSNNSPEQAQELPNPVLLQGFASAIGTAGNSQFQRFASQADPEDYFHVKLKAGQSIRLSLAPSNFAGVDEASLLAQHDLDLYLLSMTAERVQASAQRGAAGKQESLIVAQDGDYWVLVHASQGYSKYLLQIEAAPTPAPTALPEPDFIIGEALVSYHRTRTVLSTQANDDAPTLVKLHSTHRTELAANTTSTWPTHPELQAKLQTLQAIKELQQDPNVRYAEPNYLRQIMLEPNDALYAKQWHYPAVQLPQAWDFSQGQEVVVAVIDTGVLLAHPDLKNQLLAGYDFISDTNMARDGDGRDNNPDDPGDSAILGASSWHGTHVAGLVGAQSQNKTGVAGVAWQAKIMPLRVLGKGGGTVNDIVQAVRYAAGLSNASGTLPSKRADIINISFGSSSASQAEQEALQEAMNLGVIVVAAAGNSNSSASFYPASYAGVISVAATDASGNRASYSNYGSRIDIAAPGGDMSQDLDGDGNPDGILSTYVDASSGVRRGSYGYMQGTSMATPQVTGILALMKALNPALDTSKARSLLQSCALSTGSQTCRRDDELGYGQIHALLAVQQAIGDYRHALLSLSSAPNPFSANTTRQSLTLQNLGLQQAQNILVHADQAWLSIDSVPTELASQAQATLHLQAQTSGLSAGTHSATLSIRYQDTQEHELRVRITLDLSTASSLPHSAPLYVLLSKEDCAADCILASTYTDKLGNFAFDAIPAGRYRLYAGSDIDADDILCQATESCGSYPDSASGQVLQLEKDEQGLNIHVSLNTLHSLLGEKAYQSAKVKKSLPFTKAKSP